MPLRHPEARTSSEAEGEEGSRAPYDLAARFADRGFLRLIQHVRMYDYSVLVEDAQLPQVD